MASIADSFISNLNNARAILLLLNEHVPPALAFWYPIIVRYAQLQGKKIDVLVSSEGQGWVSQVDTYFPVDMKLEIEDIKQKIRIPFSGTENNFGDVTYSIGEDKFLEISVTPKEGVLDLDRIKTESQGSKYDLIIGVGVHAKHPTVQKVSNSKISTLGAKCITIGTFSSDSTFKNVLPHIQTIEAVVEGTYNFLIQTTRELVGSQKMKEDKKVIANAFALYYLFQFSPSGHYILKSDVYNAVIQLPLQDESIKLASQVFSLSGKDDSVFEALISKMQTFGNGTTRVYRLDQSDLQKLGVTVDQALIIARLLSLSETVVNAVTIIQTSPTVHYVYANGTAAQIKVLAAKYAFSVTENVTTGLVRDVYQQKLIADIIRVLTGEEIQGNVDPVVPVKPEVAEAVVTPVVVEPKVVETKPYLEQVEDDFEDYTPNQSVGKLFDEDEDLDFVPQKTEVKPQVEPAQPQAPARPPETIPVSSGLDFASIAQKMRDSITH